MTDKDFVERYVLHELFPSVPTYICLFHTFRTFKREVSVSKMGIKQKEKDTALQYLNKKAKSKTAELYDDIYKEFAATVPTSVLQYFNLNWHNIKEEWTTHKMVDGTLGNETNNRLESLNGKIKNASDRYNTLVKFIDDLFEFEECRAYEAQHEIAKKIFKAKQNRY